MIERHFATVEGRWGPRQVHYRRAGRGPTLLMLHQSPMSSRDLLPVIEAWQAHFTIVAPDTPGYGISDPLGVAAASAEDFAVATLEFLDAIGIDRTGVYGFHTGASIGAALALHAPDRVAAFVGNGLCALTEEERRDILEHYLPPFEPRWDGSHLTWLWARLREQYVFFPWYRRTLDARMDFPMPPPEVIQNALVEFLRAGDHYRIAYRAAFELDGAAVARALKVPALVVAQAADPLAEHLPRLEDPSPKVRTRCTPDMPSALAAALEFLQKHPAPPGPPVAPTAPIEGRMWNAMITVDNGQLRVRRNTDAGGRAVVVQHDAAGSADVVEPVSRSLIGRRPVVALDLPGHGESDNTIGEENVTVARYRAVVEQALDALGLEQVDFHGMWGGGLVGLDLALASPERVAHLVMSDVIHHTPEEKAMLRADYTPAWEPVWYGGHLLLCWHLMRDQGLFWPWFRRTREGIIWKEPYLDTAMIHGRVLEMFKAPRMWRLAYQSHFDYPTGEALGRVEVPTLLCAPQWDPNFGHTEAAHSAAPQHSFEVLPDALDRWGPVIAGFCDR